MPFQFSDATINASLDAIETAMGASCILRIRSGAAPANVAAASTGTVLATLNLPADWMNAASARSKTKLGTWEDLSADAAGTAGHFEVVASNGTTRHIQGSITATGGGGDMTLDNVSIAVGQTVTVTTFTINGPAA
jgi:hypothetical protein